ncbi:uncharacterized protein N7515_002807 [Penicillium bovifimosum]|uniref:Uncharacterized protein n=1 Tax=Penicillium bovifimosum TaxID=126998 RepID=A0A9W9HC82_9EURO|nr:uncharacterized protein N7515_002807 [Penicillium bovifimosum]KAJ5144020.1 hypothetical protein N7515_002807 [Penicillium bovifimosum]
MHNVHKIQDLATGTKDLAPFRLKSSKSPKGFKLLGLQGNPTGLWGPGPTSVNVPHVGRTLFTLLGESPFRTPEDKAVIAAASSTEWGRVHLEIGGRAEMLQQHAHSPDRWAIDRRMRGSTDILRSTL